MDIWLRMDRQTIHLSVYFVQHISENLFEYNNLLKMSFLPSVVKGRLVDACCLTDMF